MEIRPRRDFLLRFFASGFFISYIPTSILKNRKNSGAGFWGTVLALLLFFILPSNPVFYLCFASGFCIFSIWVCDRVEFEGGLHDNPKIVIDEIAGFWIACALLPIDVFHIIGVFILFRFFDTVKPFYISRLDKVKGGLGIVLDDIAAGLLANISIRLISQVRGLF